MEFAPLGLILLHNFFSLGVILFSIVLASVTFNRMHAKKQKTLRVIVFLLISIAPISIYGWLQSLGGPLCLLTQAVCVPQPLFLNPLASF